MLNLVMYGLSNLITSCIASKSPDTAFSNASGNAVVFIFHDAFPSSAAAVFYGIIPLVTNGSSSCAIDFANLPVIQTDNVIQ